MNVYTDSKGNRVAVYSLGLARAVSLTGVSAVQSGTALDGLSVRQNAVMTVTTTAGASAGDVQLQGSLDGTNFVNLGSAVSTTAASTTTAVVVQTAFVRYVRASITTPITGGQVNVSVGVSG